MPLWLSCCPDSSPKAWQLHNTTNKYWKLLWFLSQETIKKDSERNPRPVVSAPWETRPPASTSRCDSAILWDTRRALEGDVSRGWGRYPTTKARRRDKAGEADRTGPRTWLTPMERLAKIHWEKLEESYNSHSPDGCGAWEIQFRDFCQVSPLAPGCCGLGRVMSFHRGSEELGNLLTVTDLVTVFLQSPAHT